MKGPSALISGRLDYGVQPSRARLGVREAKIKRTLASVKLLNPVLLYLYKCSFFARCNVFLHMARKEPKMKRLPLILWPASLLIAACSTPIPPAPPAPAPQAAAPVQPTPAPSLPPAKPAAVAKTESPLEAF